jgi:hypothetical protein
VSFEAIENKASFKHSWLHKSAPKKAAVQQQKRSLVRIEFPDIDQWHHGTHDDARRLSGGGFQRLFGQTDSAGDTLG